MSHGISIDFSVRRVYLASFASIGYVLAHRGLVNQDWTATRILSAAVADGAILAVLFFCFAAIDRWLQPKSLAAQGHKALHMGIALTVVVLAIGAQALFIKTGEILDAGVLEFFLANFHDLTGASQSVIDYEILVMAAVCLGFYLVSTIKLHARAFKFLQYGLLVSPALMLIFSFAREHGSESPFLYLIPQKEGYNRDLAEMGAHQLAWLSKDSPDYWHQGILSGLSTATRLGQSEYAHIEGEIPAQPLYSPPHNLSTTSKNSPNVLFVLLESTRADVVGAYAKEPTPKAPSPTPFLDTLAHKGWRYEYAYTTIPHTSKALVGIYCGTFAQFGASKNPDPDKAYPLTCLPSLLESVSYRSAHFQTAPGAYEGRARFLASAGFSHSVTQEDLDPLKHERFGYLGLDDRLLIPPMLAWMKKTKNEGRPFFASMLTVLTHHPYASPGNVRRTRVAAEAKADYEKAVRYNDDVLRDLITEMEKAGLLDNTIVVITGDHGEAFAEHQQLAHNGAAYEEGMRVPLVVYAPGLLQESRTIGGLRQHIDIVPSILGILNIQYHGTLPGKDLFVDTQGHKEIISSCFYDNYCLNHYSDDGTKFIYFYGKRPSEFYELRTDEKEVTNLAPTHSFLDARARLARAISMKKSYAAAYPPR